MVKHEIYVSKTGDDKNIGSKASPVRTISEAVRRAASADRWFPFNIYVRGGNYHETLFFGPLDARKNKGCELIISAYNNEKVCVHGGYEIEENRISKVTDESILSRIINEEARDKIYAIDLSDKKQHLFPNRQTFQYGACRTALFRNNKMMEPARYPKRVSADRTTAGEYMHATKYDYPVSDDGQMRNVTMTVLEDSLFERMEKWDKSVLKDLWADGYFSHTWWDEYCRIISFDKKKKQIRTNDDAMFYTAPNGVALPNINVGRFYLFNIFDELSEENEFFIDYKSGIVYVYSETPLKTGDIVLGTETQHLLTIDRSVGINFKNIDFAYSQGYLVQMWDASRCTLDGCNLYCSGYGAGRISYSNNITIKNAVVTETTGGLSFNGCGNLQTLTESNCVVENCIFHDVSTAHRCYNSGLGSSVGCVGVKFLHCKLYNSPHMLLSLGSFTEVAYCEFFNAAKDSDDCAAIYWGARPDTVGNVIHDCYFHDLGNVWQTWGTNAIYQDDMGTGADIYNNIFVNVASPDKSSAIKGASFHHSHNNIFIGPNPPDGGHMYGLYDWIFRASIDFDDDAPAIGLGSNVPKWHRMLERVGFFTPEWRKKLKGTLWQKMYDSLDEGKIAQLKLYQASLEGEEPELKNAKVAMKLAELLFVGKYADGTPIEGNIFDVIKEKFPSYYQKALTDSEGAGEVFRINRIKHIVMELIWFGEIIPEYYQTLDGNLIIGSKNYAGELNDNDVMRHLNHFNNLNMENDKMPDGNSLFVDYEGGDYTMTEEGLAFVRSKIEGFEPIDFSKIGVGK